MELRVTRISTIIGIVSVIMTGLAYLGVIAPLQLCFNANLVLHKHEYWRLFTSLLYQGQISLHTIVNIYFSISYMNDVEGQELAGRPADYILFLFIGAAAAWYTGFKYGIIFLNDFLHNFILYYICKKKPDSQILLVFLNIQVKMGYLPFILLVLRRVAGANIKTDIIAYLTAHFYFFLHDACSLRYNKSFLRLSDKINNSILNILQ